MGGARPSEEGLQRRRSALNPKRGMGATRESGRLKCFDRAMDRRTRRRCSPSSLCRAWYSSADELWSHYVECLQSPSDFRQLFRERSNGFDGDS
ncbi:MAG: hypothetical protein QOI59_7015 [Gammaproteobacteria bacterium]|nr:hypothetical protein [Gammaproteobacteria bacterium]